MRHLACNVLAIVTIALGALACGSDPDPQGSAGSPPIPADADGRAVYLARCAACHGGDLRGTDRGPSQLSIVYEPGHHGDAAYRSAVRSGVPQHHWQFGNMPAVDDITDEQIELVISYIRSEQQRLGFES